MMEKRIQKGRLFAGFTLIEVLLALSVIAISLTALLKAISENTIFTQRLKEKSLGQTVAMQAIYSIQLGLIPIAVNQENTSTMTMAGQTWYWRVFITPTSVNRMQRISIRVSRKAGSGFSEPLIAFRYVR